jgi:type I restriction enzyme S subunit
MGIIAFQDVVFDKTGGNKKIVQSKYLDSGALAIVDQGQKKIAGFTNDTSLQAHVKLPCIVFGDHTKIFKYIDFPFALGADGVKVLETSEKLNPLYAYYYFGQVKLRGKEGYNRNYKYLKEIKIPVPDLSAQRKIAAILDKADGARQKRQEALRLTDQFLKSTFLELFGDPIKNPKKWQLNKLSEVGTLDRGISKNRPRNAPELLGGPYPLIQTGDIANADVYIRKYSQTYSELGLKQSKMWKVGTLSITIAANIGKTAILTFDACFPDSVVGFVANDKVKTEYVLFWFSFWQKILEDKAPESAQKNINLQLLRNLHIPMPPLPLQQRFAQIVEKAEGLKGKQRASARELDNLFNSLMQRAFRGEIT